MTQALNLANFANNLNTAGATSNSGLQNSSVTVTAGTGMSGGGAVALGSSITLTNAGVTSVAAGTGISVSASTGGVTITNSQPFSGSTSQLAKAWVYFSCPSTTVTVNGSFNVSSVTRNGTGDYTVSFTTAMSSANYAVACVAKKDNTTDLGASNYNVCSPNSYATGSIRLACGNGVGSAYDMTIANVAIFSN